MLSIITVVFNDKKGFKLTAESIVSQTAFKRIEWIVIDAASTDGTVEVIKEYSSYISYWISEPDKGIYDGMNKGIAQANGEYLLFLNAGDALHSKDTIKNIITHHSYGNVDYLSGNTIYTKQEKFVGTSMAPKEISGIYLFKQTLGHQSTFIKTNRLKQKGGYDICYKIVADAKFFFEDLIINNRSYEYINDYISNYDVTGISITKAQECNDERTRFLKQVLPQKIYDDYHRFVYGKTKLERILCKLNEKSLLYKLITVFAILLYAPISLHNRIRMFMRRIRRNKRP